jgi:hypothetical protein
MDWNKDMTKILEATKRGPGRHWSASESVGYTGQVLLLDRPEVNEKPTMKVVVDLGDAIATGEEIEKWYCEAYGFNRGTIAIQRLPSKINYPPGFAKND